MSDTRREPRHSTRSHHASPLIIQRLPRAVRLFDVLSDGVVLESDRRRGGLWCVACSEPPRKLSEPPRATPRPPTPSPLPRVVHSDTGHHFSTRTRESEMPSRSTPRAPVPRCASSIRSRYSRRWPKPPSTVRTYDDPRERPRGSCGPPAIDMQKGGHHFLSAAPEFQSDKISSPTPPS